MRYGLLQYSTTYYDFLWAYLVTYYKIFSVLFFIHVRHEKKLARLCDLLWKFTFYFSLLACYCFYIPTRWGSCQLQVPSNAQDILAGNISFILIFQICCVQHVMCIGHMSQRQSIFQHIFFH